MAGVAERRAYEVSTVNIFLKFEHAADVKAECEFHELRAFQSGELLRKTWLLSTPSTYETELKNKKVEHCQIVVFQESHSAPSGKVPACRHGCGSRRESRGGTRVRSFGMHTK